MKVTVYTSIYHPKLYVEIDFTHIDGAQPVITLWMGLKKCNILAIVIIVTYYYRITSIDIYIYATTAIQYKPIYVHSNLHFADHRR